MNNNYQCTKPLACLQCDGSDQPHPFFAEHLNEIKQTILFYYSIYNEKNKYMQEPYNTYVLLLCDGGILP